MEKKKKFKIPTLSPTLISRDYDPSEKDFNYPDQNFRIEIGSYWINSNGMRMFLLEGIEISDGIMRAVWKKLYGEEEYEERKVMAKWLDALEASINESARGTLTYETAARLHEAELEKDKWKRDNVSKEDARALIMQYEPVLKKLSEN